MVVTSPAPSGLLNRHRSTAMAFSEKSAKLTPAPSQVAPSGYGCPGHTFMTFFISSLMLPVLGCRGPTWSGGSVSCVSTLPPPSRRLSRRLGNREREWIAHLHAREGCRRHVQHDRLALGRMDLYPIYCRIDRGHRRTHDTLWITNLDVF